MKVLKWIGIVLGVLIGLIVVIGLVGYSLGGAKLTEEYEYTPENIIIPTDAESVANGKYVVEHFML